MLQTVSKTVSKTVSRTVFQTRLLRAIDLYQQAFAGRLSPCRFFPSCSNYSQEAITVHGSMRGCWLTLRRLSRCRPFGPSGYDPVPELLVSELPVECCQDHATATKVIYENV